MNSSESPLSSNVRLARRVLYSVFAGLLIVGFVGQAQAYAQFGGFKPPKFDNPLPGLGNAAKEAEKRAREEAERAARMARENRDRLQNAINQAHNEVNRVQNQFNQLKQQVAKYDEIRRLVTEANSPDRRTRERAYAKLRQNSHIKSNRNDIQSRLRRNNASVINGIEIDHYDYYLFTKAVAASVVSGNPAPVTAYLKQLLNEMAERVERELRRESQAVRRRVQAELETLVIKALNDAINGNRELTVDYSGFSIDVGLATYNNAVPLIYDEPRLDKTHKVHGIQMYGIGWKKVNQELPLPNTHQPYIRIKVGTIRIPDSGNTTFRPTVPGSESGVTRPSIPRPSTSPPSGTLQRIPNGSSSIPTPRLGLNGNAQPGRGYSITGVNAGSLAARVGLEVGDIVVSVDGTKVSSASDITAALASVAVSGRRTTILIVENVRKRHLSYNDRLERIEVNF